MTIYLIGYFASMIYIYLYNKFTLEENWKKISLLRAFVLSCLSWLFIITMTLTILSSYLGIIFKKFRLYNIKKFYNILNNRFINKNNDYKINL